MIAWIEKGGPVVWPLLALSFVTTTVVLERMLFWWRARERMEELRALVRSEGLEKMERRMARGMLWIDTTITVAPMLGILGTVLGIIESFELLGAESRPDPSAVSGGIAQALITTALGLVVAMSAILPFNWLRGKMREALSELEAPPAADGER